MKLATLRRERSCCARPDFRGGVFLALSLVFSTTLYAQAPAPSASFCALPWPLEQNAQKVLETAAQKVLDPARTAARRWPSRTIPFAVDDRVKGLDGLYVAVKESARRINNFSNIKLAECPLSVAEDIDGIKGYIYVSTSDVWCDGGCCALDVGYKPKLLWGFIKTLRSRDIARGSTIGIGASACRPGRTIGGIMHEFLHTIGLNHAHQSPPSRKYVDLVEGDSSQCGMESDWHWMQQYDPASIMHYSLRTSICTLVLKKKPDDASRYTIDDLADSGEICGYNGVSGQNCFDRGADFGNRQCLSFTDQAWLYAMYKDVEEYGFDGLEKLIQEGKCNIIK